MAPVHLEQTATAVPYGASIAQPPSSLLTRTQKFVEENQRLIVLGCAVAASAGAGYYFYSRSSDKPGPSAGSKKNNKKNKKKKNDKFVKGEGSEGPLLEEITPKPAAASASKEEKVEKNEEVKPEVKVEEQPKESKTSHLDDVPDAAGLAAMSDTERNALGATLKDRGNKLYSKKDFERAVECYTKAIEVSKKRDAVFFSNRAACYTNFKPPQYEKVVADCDEALKLDRTYSKALKRRAAAYEHLQRELDALRDFTAVTVIDEFKDEQAMMSLERCLQKFATKKAPEVFKTREPKLPGAAFISSYLSAFRPRPKPTLPENPSQGDQTLLLAFDALHAADYAHAWSFVNEAIDQGVSWTEGQAEAYNLRATFKFMMSDPNGAKADFETSLDRVPSFVQSWVKLASVHVELQDLPNALGDFENAIRYNPNDPDIYYHRGQVNYVQESFAAALVDYAKSEELDKTFLLTYVQQAVCHYRLENVTQSLAIFRKVLKDFPDRYEPSNYYGEVLMDQKRFSESMERFDRAIELAKTKKPHNALPTVNKALATFQWKQDVVQAEGLLRKALEIDPECDAAVATIAQLALQQGKLDEAIEWFELSSKLARNVGELTNSLAYEYAARAQREFMRDYPELAERITPFGRAAAAS